MGFLIIIGATVLLLLLVTVIGRRSAKKAMEPNKAEQETIDRLMATGSKARATLTSIMPTGLTIANQHVQVTVTFWIDPLDRSPGFEAAKKMYFVKTQFPRQGERWPSWFDPADHAQFAVAVPAKLEPEQVPLYREFGIEHPLDLR